MMLFDTLAYLVLAVACIGIWYIVREDLTRR